MKFSRFVRGGAATQPRAPNTIPVEQGLNEARLWQTHLRGHRQYALRNADPDEPREWYRNADRNWVQRTPDELAEALARWEFNRRNMQYHDFNDRWDARTDIGYVHSIHRQFGLDVILHIPHIRFTRANFGSPEEIRNNNWANNIFTEISIEPGAHFVDLNSSGDYTTPYHYHITLVHTFDVGKGFNWDEGKIAEWIYHYNRLRSKYDDKHARLKLDRWGNGYTFYIREAEVVGLPETDNLTGDVDLNFVFEVPGKHKAGDGLHVSLLI